MLYLLIALFACLALSLVTLVLAEPLIGFALLVAAGVLYGEISRLRGYSQGHAAGSKGAVYPRDLYMYDNPETAARALITHVDRMIQAMGVSTESDIVRGRPMDWHNQVSWILRCLASTPLPKPKRKVVRRIEVTRPKS